MSTIYEVGSDATYLSVMDAVTAINAGSPPTATDRALIRVHPGKYIHTEPVTIPQWTGLCGVMKEVVQFQNDHTDLFVCDHNNWFENFVVEGSPNPNIYAFIGNNKIAIGIRRVDMWNNGGVARQRFLRQVGPDWKILFMEHCLVDYRGLNDYAVFLHNTSGAARFVDTVINDVFFDAYMLTEYGGSFEVRGCQDVRFKRSTIRGAATWNTGIRVEKGGVTGTPYVEIVQCDMTNVANSPGGVAIYNEPGTNVYVYNTDAKGSIVGIGGGRIARNSYTGA